MLQDEDWDFPIFKRLSWNDSGQSPGHQSGFVLPRELREFLPSLDESVLSLGTPTIDMQLKAELFLELHQVGEDDVRYQYQTWGGSRSPESRITGRGYAPIRGESSEGDIVILQRSLDSSDLFRVILVRQTSTEEFRDIDGLAGTRDWGELLTGSTPLNRGQLVVAQSSLEAESAKPFQVQVGTPRRRLTRGDRIARTTAFRDRIRSEYDGRCAVSGLRLTSSAGKLEIHAAHIVLLSENGPDDIRNGLALTGTLHWAFDSGLFGVRDDRTIYIPTRAADVLAGTLLIQFDGQPIREARSPQYHAHPDAMRWHRENVVSRWA